MDGFRSRSTSPRGFGPLATGLGIRKGTASRRCPFSVSDGLVRTDLATLACASPLGVCFRRDADKTTVTDLARTEATPAHVEVMRPAHLLGRAKLVDGFRSVVRRRLLRPGSPLAWRLLGDVGHRIGVALLYLFLGLLGLWLLSRCGAARAASRHLGTNCGHGGIHLAECVRWTHYLLTNTPVRTDAPLQYDAWQHAMCGHETQKRFL